jgi:hypothetical protein
MKRPLAVSFAVVVLIGGLGALPSSAFNIQSRTEQICECVCTRWSCEHGADFVTVSTTCPTGAVVTGGGYRWQTEPNLQKVQDSFPDAGGGAWTAIVKAPHESPCSEKKCGNLTVYAICAEAPPTQRNGGKE